MKYWALSEDESKRNQGPWRQTIWGPEVLASFIRWSISSGAGTRLNEKSHFVNQVDINFYLQGAFYLWGSQALHKRQPKKKKRVLWEKTIKCPQRKFGERSNLDWVIREGFSDEVPLRISPEGWEGASQIKRGTKDSPHTGEEQGSGNGSLNR